MFQIVDGGVFQTVAVQVATDDFDNAFFKALTLVIEVDKIQLLTNGFQSFGEFRLEQLFQGALVRCAIHTHGTGNVKHIVGGFIHPHEEGHGDVCAHIIAADQTIRTAAVDGDGFHRNIHDFRAMDNRPHQATGKGHLWAIFHGVNNKRFALIDLFIKGLKNNRGTTDNK